MENASGRRREGRRPRRTYGAKDEIYDKNKLLVNNDREQLTGGNELGEKREGGGSLKTTKHGTSNHGSTRLPSGSVGAADNYYQRGVCLLRHHYRKPGRVSLARVVQSSEGGKCVGKGKSITSDTLDSLI